VDRRHAAIAAVVLAPLAVGCGKDEPGPLFEGSESLELGPSTVKGDETRAWMVSAEVSLPQEAEDATYESVLEMDIVFSSAEGSMDAAFVVRDCDGGGPVHENLSFPREGHTESTSAESIEFPAFLADCPIQKCVRTMCVEATNHRNALLELSVLLRVSLVSDASVEDDGATIDVPIDLTLEEIEP
jgi:hypothetical protein